MQDLTTGSIPRHLVLGSPVMRVEHAALGTFISGWVGVL
jgi:hypothetical protein